MYADIIIDISHEKLDRPFQYRIPEALEETIYPGVSVKVPFGKGNRILQGFVIELKEQAEFAEDKIKEINSVAEGSVAIETQLIALAAWMRRNYGATRQEKDKSSGETSGMSEHGRKRGERISGRM